MRACVKSQDQHRCGLPFKGGSSASDNACVEEQEGSSAVPDLFELTRPPTAVSSALQSALLSDDARRTLQVIGYTFPALLVARLFDMPFLHGDAQAGGIPVPSGTVFVVGVAAYWSVRRWRVIQQCLLPLVASLFFAEGLPLLLTPFAPTIRYVFFFVVVGSTVSLYEWIRP
jgi:hypothetical protein